MEWRRPDLEEYLHLVERVLPLELPEGRWAYWIDPRDGTIWALPIDMAGSRARRRKKLGKLREHDSRTYFYFVHEAHAVRVSRAAYEKIGYAPPAKPTKRKKPTKR